MWSAVILKDTGNSVNVLLAPFLIGQKNCSHSLPFIILRGQTNGANGLPCSIRNGG